MKKLLLIICTALFAINTAWSMEESNEVKNANKEFQKINMNFDFSQNKENFEKSIENITDNLYKNLLIYLYNQFPKNEEKISLDEKFVDTFKKKTGLDLQKKTTAALQSLKDQLLINIYFDALQEQYKNTYIRFPVAHKETFKLIFINNSPEQAIREAHFSSKLPKDKNKNLQGKKALRTLLEAAEEKAGVEETTKKEIESKKTKLSEKESNTIFDTFGAGLKNISEHVE